MEEIDRPAVDLDLVAASLRADSSDLTAFVESLAAKLEEAVPGRVRVDRRRSGMFGPKAVRGVAVDLGDQRLELRADGGAVQTRCSRLSGGIVLKNEVLDTDDVAGHAQPGAGRRGETQRNDPYRRSSAC